MSEPQPSEMLSDDIIRARRSLAVALSPLSLLQLLLLIKATKMAVIVASK
ncbi:MULTISPECIES: hypothetical protein [unclassified Endozoicomonas]|nr:MULTISPECIES: hypothetical protein [unclassified Endozoicomonas]